MCYPLEARKWDWEAVVEFLLGTGVEPRGKVVLGMETPPLRGARDLPVRWLLNAHLLEDYTPGSL